MMQYVILLMGWIVWVLFTTKIGRIILIVGLVAGVVHHIHAKISPDVVSNMSETDVPKYVTAGGVVRELHESKTGYGDYVSISITNNSDLATPDYDDGGMWVACSVRVQNNVPGDGSNMRLIQANQRPDIDGNLQTQIVPAHSTKTLEFNANASMDFRVRAEHHLQDCVVGGSAPQAAAMKGYNNVDEDGGS